MKNKKVIGICSMCLSDHGCMCALSQSDLVTPPPVPEKKKIESLKIPVHFGSDYASHTDVHNDLVPYFNKINEIIDWINNHD